MSSPDVILTKAAVGTPKSFQQPMTMRHGWEPSKGNKITLPHSLPMTKKMLNGH